LVRNLRNAQAVLPVHWDLRRLVLVPVYLDTALHPSLSIRRKVVRYRPFHRAAHSNFIAPHYLELTLRPVITAAKICITARDRNVAVRNCKAFRLLRNHYRVTGLGRGWPLVGQHHAEVHTLARNCSHCIRRLHNTELSYSIHSIWRCFIFPFWIFWICSRIFCPYSDSVVNSSYFGIGRNSYCNR